MKTNTIARQRRATVRINAFGDVDVRVGQNAGLFKSPVLAYNFDSSGGTLKGGAGFAKKFQTPLPERARAIRFYRRNDPVSGADDRAIVIGASGKVYSVSAGGAATLVSGLTLSGDPVAVNYNYNGSDVLILASAEDGTFIYDGESVTEIPSAPPIASACIHYERLFATTADGRSLWFSDDFDPANWSVSLSEAGFIDMSDFRGQMLSAVSFGGYLYVFRKYGITRVAAYADQTEFTVSDLFVSSGAIIKDSVTLCGDRMIFASSDGFYSFNGLDASKILSAVSPAIDFSAGVKGKFFGGKAYFLVSDFSGGGKKILVYDVQGGSHYFINAANIADIELIDGLNEYALYAIDSGGTQIMTLTDRSVYGETPLRKVWQSRYADFGVPAGRKVLSSASLYASADVELEVTDGVRSAVYALKGGRGRLTVRPGLLGDRFAVKITCDEENVEISSLSLTFGYYL